MLAFEFLRVALVGSLLAGVGLGVVGVLLLLLGMPFLGICLSHAAFLGAVVAVLIGVHPLVGALVLCLVAVVSIWPVAERTKSGASGALSVVMAATMGLAFICMSKLPGPKSEALTLVWGSVLTITRPELIGLLCITVLVIVTVVGFRRWIAAVLYDRDVACSAGVPVRAVLFGILLVAGAVVSVSLDIVGGLLIFALLVNPASAAYHVTDRLPMTYLLAALFGVISTVGGLGISYWLDLPAGAVMTLVSSVIFLVALLRRPHRCHSAQ